MKKLMLIATLAVAFVGCQKQLEKNNPIADKYTVQNDTEILADRFEETVEDITLDDESNTAGNLQWMHVARVESPIEGGNMLVVADVEVESNLAYVAYYNKSADFKSVIDVIDMSDEDIPSLVSSLEIKDLDLQFITSDANALYAIGKSSYGTTQLVKVVLEAGKLTAKVIEKEISVAMPTGILIAENNVVVTSEDNAIAFNSIELTEVSKELTANLKSAGKVSANGAEFTYVIADKTAKKINLTNGNVEGNYNADASISDLADYKDITVATSEFTGVSFLAPYKDSYKRISGYPLPATSVATHAEFIIIGELGGGVSIIQGIEEASYEKCRNRKKNKKKRRRNRNRGDRNNNNVDFGGCQCEDGLSSFKFTYNGNSGERMDFFDKCGRMIVCYPNLQNGQTYEVSGVNTSNGKLDSKTYIKYRGCWYTLPTNCNINLLVKELGVIDVVEFTDGQNSVCDYDTYNTPEDTTACKCDGRMQSFSFIYTGEAGKTIYAWDKKLCDVFQVIENAQVGETYTINGFGNNGQLGWRTVLAFTRHDYQVINTSCQEDILGAEFGPFAISEFVDGAGDTCSVETPDPQPNEKFTECEVKGADPGYAFFQAVWLDDFSLLDGILYDRGFRFEGGYGIFRELPDGKAVLTGEIYSPNYPNNRWDMTVYFTGKSNWEDWSAQGKTYKKGAGYIEGAHENWTYYMIDTEKTNVMVGLGDNAGFTSNITQRPDDGSMGFQIGEGGANDKNSAYGMAGWFWYEHPDGDLRKADWNVDVITCVEK